jgi:hypothetical protein
MLTHPTRSAIANYNRLLAEVRQQATGNRQQWEELEFFGIKLI